jgi:ribosome recycling factor
MVDMNDVSRRMGASVTSLSNDFSGLRAGRASTTMLDPVSVDAYGSKMPLNQVSNVSAPESRLLTVTVWDAGLADAVEKAIRESGLGLNPQIEGTVIRIPVPDLSEERRKEMVKVAGKYAEASRVAIRNIRRDAIEAVRKAEKEGGMSEDERHGLESETQKLTDSHISKIDEMLTQKEKDILGV